MNSIIQQSVSTGNERLEAALRYVELGWALLPLKPRSKKPYAALLPRDANGKPSWRLLATKSATAGDVERWFASDPDCNIGIILGKPSGGLAVLDEDRRLPPSVLKTLPPTSTARSGRGWHRYFVASPSQVSMSFSWGELRANGEYITAPPSSHPSGLTYSWAEGLSPDVISPVELPQSTHHSLSVCARKRKGHKQLGVNLDKENNDLWGVGSDETLAAENGGRHLVGELASNERLILAMLRDCGVAKLRLETPFLCPLPGHSERSPSAMLHRQPDDGTIGFRDWHHKSSHEWYTPVEVWRAVKTGVVRKFPPGAQAVWLIRAAVQFGVMRAPFPLASRRLHLPDDASPTVRSVWDGFLLLLACRALYDGRQTAAPFSRQFAAEWCGPPPSNCERAIYWLEEYGFLKAAGIAYNKRKQPVRLWAIGGGQL